MTKKILLKKLEKNLSLPLVSTLGLLLITLIGIADYTSNPLLDFSLFYMVPILFCTWFGGKRLGSLVALFCVISYFFTQILGNETQEHHLFHYWHVFTHIASYWMIAQLLSRLKEQLYSQHRLARTDAVTGSANARYFRELLELEIQRFERYRNPFTLVYFDLDNFKQINDILGHTTGDEVLKMVVTLSQKHLRDSDIVARLGGDEFGVLMPETNSTQAKLAIQRLKDVLSDAMQERQWPVTFSMGGISCVEGTTHVLKLIQLADQLMYEVKSKGKDGIKHLSFSEAQDTLDNSQKKQSALH